MSKAGAKIFSSKHVHTKVRHLDIVFVISSWVSSAHPVYEIPLALLPTVTYLGVIKSSNHKRHRFGGL